MNKLRGMRWEGRHPGIPDDALELLFNDNGELRPDNLIRIGREVPRDQHGVGLKKGDVRTREYIVEKQIYKGSPMWDFIRITPSSQTRDDGFLRQYLFPDNGALPPQESDNLLLGYFKLAKGESALSQFLKFAQENGLVEAWEVLGTVIGEIDESTRRLGGYSLAPVIWGLDKSDPFFPSRHTTNTFATGSVADSTTLKGQWEVRLDTDEGRDKKRKMLQEWFGWVDENDVRFFTERVHRKILEIIYTSNARMTVLGWVDILGLDSSYQLNIPGAQTQQWVKRLPRDVTVEAILAAAKGQASTERVAKAVKLLKELGESRKQNYDDGIPKILNVDPGVGTNMEEIREEGELFLIDAYVYGDIKDVNMIVNIDGKSSRVPMQRCNVRSGLAKNIQKWTVNNWSPKKPGRYNFYIEAITSKGEVVNSKSGRLFLTPKNSEMNTLSPGYAGKFYPAEPAAMDKPRGVGAAFNGDAAFSEDYKGLDSLIAGLGMKPDSSDAEIDEELVRIASDARYNDKLLKILGFNSKQRLALSSYKGDLFGSKIEKAEDITSISGIKGETVRKAREKIRLSIKLQQTYKHDFAKFALLAYVTTRGDEEEDVNKNIEKVFGDDPSILRNEKFLNAMSEYFVNDPQILLSLAYIVWAEIRAGPESAAASLLNILIKLSRINRGWMLSYYKLAAIRYLDLLHKRKDVSGILRILATRPPKDPKLCEASFQTLVELARKGTLSSFYAFVKPGKPASFAVVAVKVVAKARAGTPELKRFLAEAKQHKDKEVQEAVLEAEKPVNFIPASMDLPAIKGVPHPELLKKIRPERMKIITSHIAFQSDVLMAGIMPTGATRRLAVDAETYFDEEGYLFGYLACAKAIHLWGEAAIKEDVARRIFNSVYETVGHMSRRGSPGATIYITMLKDDVLEVICENSAPRGELAADLLEKIAGLADECSVESAHNKLEKGRDGVVKSIGRSDKGSGAVVKLKWRRPDSGSLFAASAIPWRVICIAGVAIASAALSLWNGLTDDHVSVGPAIASTPAWFFVPVDRVLNWLKNVMQKKEKAPDVPGLDEESMELLKLYVSVKPRDLSNMSDDDIGDIMNLAVDLDVLLDDRLSLLKALAIREGVSAETVVRAFQSEDLYHDLIITLHPYRRKADRELGEYVTCYEGHEGAYFALRALKRKDRLPPNLIVVNVDPHDDIFNSPVFGDPVVFSTWASSVLRDGLAKAYVQVSWDGVSEKPIIWLFNPDDNGIAETSPSHISEEELVRLLEHNYSLLTIDADYFSLKSKMAAKVETLYHYNPSEFKRRIGPVNSCFERANRMPLRIVLAESRRYLSPKADSEWVRKWKNSLMGLYRLWKEKIGRLSEYGARKQVKVWQGPTPPDAIDRAVAGRSGRFASGKPEDETLKKRTANPVKSQSHAYGFGSPSIDFSLDEPSAKPWEYEMKQGRKVGIGVYPKTPLDFLPIVEHIIREDAEFMKDTFKNIFGVEFDKSAIERVNVAYIQKGGIKDAFLITVFFNDKQRRSFAMKTTFPTIDQDDRINMINSMNQWRRYGKDAGEYVSVYGADTTVYVRDFMTEVRVLAQEYIQGPTLGDILGNEGVNFNLRAAAVKDAVECYLRAHNQFGFPIWDPKPDNICLLYGTVRNWKIIDLDKIFSGGEYTQKPVRTREEYIGILANYYERYLDFSTDEMLPNFSAVLIGKGDKPDDKMRKVQALAKDAGQSYSLEFGENETLRKITDKFAAGVFDKNENGTFAMRVIKYSTDEFSIKLIGRRYGTGVANPEDILKSLPPGVVTIESGGRRWQRDLSGEVKDDGMSSVSDGARVTLTVNLRSAIMPQKIAGLPVVWAGERNEASLRIACVQIRNNRFIDNKNTVENIIKELGAMDKGAPSLILFPEMTNTYHYGQNESAIVEQLQSLADKYNTAIGYSIENVNSSAPKEDIVTKYFILYPRKAERKTEEFKKYNNEKEKRIFEINGLKISMLICREAGFLITDLMRNPNADSPLLRDIRNSDILILPSDTALFNSRENAQNLHKALGKPVLFLNTAGVKSTSGTSLAWWWPSAYYSPKGEIALPENEAILMTDVSNPTVDVSSVRGKISSFHPGVGNEGYGAIGAAKVIDEASQKLKQNVIDRIRENGGRITFEEFQNVAAVEGYYEAGLANFGIASTDGVTFKTDASASVAIVFARQFYDFWNEMGRPDRFDIVEQGGGDGSMALYILDIIKEGEGFRDFYDHIKYTIIDISSDWSNRQEKLLHSRHPGAQCVTASVLKMPFQDKSVEGVFFSNELPDAFPVHRVVTLNGKLKEIYVTYDGNEFKEECGDISTDEISKYFELVGTLPPEGKEFAVNLRLLPWMREVSRSLKRGFVVTSDYGFGKTATRYSSEHKESVWNLTENPKLPLLTPGIDITHNVDFETLDKIAARVGLDHEHLGSLDSFFSIFSSAAVPINPEEFILVSSKGMKTDLSGKPATEVQNVHSAAKTESVVANFHPGVETESDVAIGAASADVKGAIPESATPIIDETTRAERSPATDDKGVISASAMQFLISAGLLATLSGCASDQSRTGSALAVTAAAAIAAGAAVYFLSKNNKGYGHIRDDLEEWFLDAVKPRERVKVIFEDPIKVLFTDNYDEQQDAVEQLKGASRDAADRIVKEIISATEEPGKESYPLSVWIDGLVSIGKNAIPSLEEALGTMMMDRSDPPKKYRKIRYWAISALQRIGDVDAEIQLLERLRKFYEKYQYLAVDGGAFILKEDTFDGNFDASKKGGIVMNTPFCMWGKISKTPFLVFHCPSSPYGLIDFESCLISSGVKNVFSEYKDQIEVYVGVKRLRSWEEKFTVSEATQNGIWIFPRKEIENSVNTSDSESETILGELEGSYGDALQYSSSSETALDANLYKPALGGMADVNERERWIREADKGSEEALGKLIAHITLSTPYKWRARERIDISNQLTNDDIKKKFLVAVQSAEVQTAPSYEIGDVPILKYPERVIVKQGKANSSGEVLGMIDTGTNVVHTSTHIMAAVLRDGKIVFGVIDGDKLISMPEEKVREQYPSLNVRDPWIGSLLRSASSLPDTAKLSSATDAKGATPESAAGASFHAGVENSGDGASQPTTGTVGAEKLSQPPEVAVPMATVSGMPVVAETYTTPAVTGVAKLPGDDIGDIDGTKVTAVLNSGADAIRDMIGKADVRLREALAANPLPDDAQILLLDELFDDSDMDNLNRVLYKHKVIKIMSFEDMQPIITDKNAVREDAERKTGCVITRSRFDQLCRVRGISERDREKLKATILVIDDLRGSNYLYLEGVLALVKSMMDKDASKIRMNMNLIFKRMTIDDSILIDSALLAMRVALKFKPIVEIDPEMLERYKAMMENLLMAA
ncbi:MAG: SAM-dependent methyltransferase [Candidatus Omnitrophota bacterium]